MSSHEPNEDEVLVQLTKGQVADDPTTQVVADLYARLRAAKLAWWSPERLRALWPFSTRLKWFVERPDIRQRVTHQLTGLAPRAARAMPAESQAALIEACIEAGDVTLEAVELAFDPNEVAVHAASQVWSTFKAQMPWDQRTPEHEALLVWLLEALLVERETHGAKLAILTPLLLRSAVDGRAWQEHLPIDLRVAIDATRLRSEWEGKPFGAAQELELIQIPRLVQHLPLTEVRRVLDAAERVLQLEQQDNVLAMREAKRTATDRVKRRATG